MEYSELEKKLLALKALPEAQLVIPLKIEALSHQKIGINFMIERLQIYNNVFNMDEMGLGKTFQSIITALILKEKGLIKKVLVVCPSTVKYGWKREIEKFSSEKVLVVTGDKHKRIDLYNQFRNDENIMFLIANYECIRCDEKILKTLITPI